jgi:hypothetical protein
MAKGSFRAVAFVGRMRLKFTSNSLDARQVQNRCDQVKRTIGQVMEGVRCHGNLNEEKVKWMAFVRGRLFAWAEPLFLLLVFACFKSLIRFHLLKFNRTLLTTATLPNHHDQ